MAATIYPKVSTKAWRTLQERASAAPTVKFTPQTVAAMLGMASPASAKDNVVSPMRRLGLIDDDGLLTDRGRKWRVKESYAAACQEILDEVYPDDLLNLTDGSGAIDAGRVQTWFEHSGLGTSNARSMAATFAMIARKELPEASPTDSKKSPNPRTRPESRNDNKKTVNEPLKPKDPDDGAGEGTRQNLPNVHLDIQIHIPADASPDQIDQIFASMGKHLYGR